METIFSKSNQTLNGNVTTNEKEYLLEYFKLYIIKEGNFEKTATSDKGWEIKADYKTAVRTMILQYIVENFSMNEMFFFFANPPHKNVLDNPSILSSRDSMIKILNNSTNLSDYSLKRFKRKIWNTNPIVLGLIIELVINSGIYWKDKQYRIQRIIPKNL